MDVQQFEKIALNADILILIYNLLNSDDQLRLAQVNANLGYVFKEFIWKDQDYRTLYVRGCETDYLVENISCKNSKLLTWAGLQEFKSVYADDVHELTFRMNKEPYLSEIVQSLSGALSCGKPFINLKSVVCHVPNIHSITQLMAKNLPHLESLCLYKIDCKTEQEVEKDAVEMDDEELDDEELDDVEKDDVEMDDEESDDEELDDVEKEDVENLLQIKNLKRLCLECFAYTQLKYQYFCQLIYELQLEVFEGYSMLIYDNDENGAEELLFTQEVQLKELTIYTTFNRKKSPSSYATFFKMFENITKLVLTVSKGINEEMWAALTKSCKNLNFLTVEYTTFKNVTTFSIPSTVTNLHLFECSGLTHKNLRQILTETNITEFDSFSTEYSLMEEFEDISISPLIEILVMDILDVYNFISFFKQSENLKHLTLLIHSDIKEVSGPHLQSCVNLETLHISFYSQICHAAVLQLKHLRELHASIESECMWSYICALLRHPPLRKLSIHCSPSGSEIKPSIEGFPTKVTTLVMTYLDRCPYVSDFFLDLFRQNWNLQLSFNEYYLQRLITSRYFPRDLKEIQICEFTINCSDLRKNFECPHTYYTFHSCKITLCRK